MGSETMGLKVASSLFRTVEAAKPIGNKIVNRTQNKLTTETMRGPFWSRRCVRSHSQNRKDPEVSIKTTQQN